MTLDVFGGALRESTPWDDELNGLYAGMQIVAEMKRTDRDIDQARARTAAVIRPELMKWLPDVSDHFRKYC